MTSFSILLFSCAPIRHILDKCVRAKSVNFSKIFSFNYTFRQMITCNMGFNDFLLTSIYAFCKFLDQENQSQGPMIFREILSLVSTLLDDFTLTQILLSWLYIACFQHITVSQFYYFCIVYGSYLEDYFSCNDLVDPFYCCMYMELGLTHRKILNLPGSIEFGFD